MKYQIKFITVGDIMNKVTFVLVLLLVSMATKDTFAKAYPPVDPPSNSYGCKGYVMGLYINPGDSSISYATVNITDWLNRGEGPQTGPDTRDHGYIAFKNDKYVMAALINAQNDSCLVRFRFSDNLTGKGTNLISYIITNDD